MARSSARAAGRGDGMKKFGTILVLAFVLGMSLFYGYHRFFETPTRPAGISVTAEGDVPAATMQAVEQAASLFTGTMEQQHAPLTHGVQIFVAATQGDYKAVIMRDFEQSAEEAQAIADVSGGWTGGKRGLTALNGAAGVMKTESDCVSTTAHELFHQLQFELSDGNDTDERAIFWLEEGSADYVGALIAEQAGGKTLRKWQLDTLTDLRLTKETVKPNVLTHCTLEQRMRLMAKEYHTYQVADAMVICLMQQQKGRELSSLLSYFRALRTHAKGEEAFEEAFGISHNKFLKEFHAWYKKEMQIPATFTFESRAGVRDGLAGTLQRELKTALPFVKQAFGAQPHGRFTVVLCADENDFAAAIAEICAIPREEATSLADGNLWIESGSTIILQIGQLTNERQQAYAMATLLCRLLRVETSGRPEDQANAELDEAIEMFLENYGRRLARR